MSLQNGSMLGPFEIQSAIGAGGMGEVYRAKDTRLNRTVAIKVLPAHLSSNPDLQQRFEREARAVSSLNHPNICTLHDIGHQNGTDYLVMEFLEGETLADRLRKGPLPLEQTLRYGIQIADALQAAHKRGIIHRDLKPGNVMLTKSGAKLLDFGLAKVAFATPEKSDSVSDLATEEIDLTAEGTIVGTFQYMAPEQLEEGKADARTDIFAMGAVLYEMATGKKAFTGKSRASLISAIISYEPQPISSLQPLTPRAFERLVKICLVKDPDSRWQTAQDVMLELQGISESVSQPEALRPASVERKRHLGWILAGIFFTISLASLPFLIRNFYASKTPMEVFRFSVSLPDKVAFSFDVAIQQLSISPNGRYIAFIATSAGKRMLWVRPLKSLLPEALVGTEGALSPFWSPDSRYIAFFAEGKLKKIEVSGGTSETVAKLSAGEGRVGTWGRGQTILFSGSDGIYRVPAEGGSPSLLMKFDNVFEVTGKSDFYWMNFLPDGKHFLMSGGFRKSTESESMGIFIGNIDSTETRVLLPAAQSRSQYAAPGYLLYVREGTLIAHPFDAKNFRFSGKPIVLAGKVAYFEKTGWSEFSVSDTGTLVYMSDVSNSQLVWYDRSGRKLGDIGVPDQYYAPRISPDGQRLATVIADPATFSGDLWIEDLTRKTRTRFTYGRADDGETVWSPDGKRLAFFSCCEDKSTLHIKRTNDPGKGDVLLPSGFQVPCDWSTDGNYIIYTERDPRRNVDLWILPLSQAEKPFPFLQSQFDEHSARFSPDGRWVAFVSNESGQDEVYAASFEDSNERLRVSTSGGTSPRWRRDSQELFYITPDNRIMAVPVASEPVFKPGSPSPLFRVDGALTTDYDVTADGQRLLINTTSSTAQSLPFQVVVNALPQ